jgi:hypothetical protein
MFLFPFAEICFLPSVFLIYSLNITLRPFFYKQ